MKEAVTAARPSRYARQLALRGFGEPAQRRLSGARVMLVGLGGLGSPAATYLATAGIGHLTINDFDTVHSSNLHRQTLYSEIDVGTRKVAAAEARLGQLNATIELETIDHRLSPDALLDRIGDVDLVLDCTDNFASRKAINTACVLQGKMLVSGAVSGMDGQLAVFPCDRAGPCYQCLTDGIDDNLGDCQGDGILGPVAGVIGGMMAVEAIKIVTGLGQPLTGRVIVYDGLSCDFRMLKLPRNPDCTACGQQGKR